MAPLPAANSAPDGYGKGWFSGARLPILMAMVKAITSWALPGFRLAVPVVVAGMFMAACGPLTLEEDFPTEKSEQDQKFPDDDVGLFGADGLLFFGQPDEERTTASPIAVNAYLWRASLDTLSFMPLSSADAFGGVIITDWYAPPETPDHRFKANIYILDRRLRSDGVRVALFHQRRDGNGQWVDAQVHDQTATKLEDAILTRARQLRVGAVR
jgi:hypothetical protein